MAILVLDPAAEARIRGLWPGVDDDRWTEVWEGVTVMSPLANTNHQDIVGGLQFALYDALQRIGHARVFPGLNLSDRTPDWVENYRNPDLVVFLTGSAAVDHGTHWVGGPDLVVEVISPGEPPTAKFAFYESIGTREVMVLHRDPWRLELFTLVAGRLVLAGESELPSSSVVESAALGLTFALVPGDARPRIAVTHPATGRTWQV